MPPGLGQRPLTTTCPIVVEQGSLLYKARAEEGIAMQDMPSESPELRLEREGDIGFVIASNPARMNAFTAGMWRALPEVLAAAEADAAIRVIVLRGAGTRAFSAGADISEFDTARSGDATTAYDALNDAAFRALSGCTKPTIAMIHGFCLGGGFGHRPVHRHPLSPTKRPSSPSPPPSSGLATTRAGFAACSPPCRRRAPRNCCSRGGASKLQRLSPWASSTLW